MNFDKRFSLIAPMAIVATMASAQMTTSSMSGHITDENGEPIIGANVVAVHTPSGTRYGAMTNNDGLYTMQGMRVGGPYEITISYIGYKTTVYKDVVLSLAENFALNSSMTVSDNQLGEAVVATTRATKFSTQKTGAATNISNADMVSMPTVSRSVTDFTRLSPYGGNGMSFQGSDGRTGNFTVDGANFNNNFGLSSNLPGGGSPISIEAIEEMQVVISPFDVRQTGFIGGAVNAITKSGTNKVHGSAYVYHKNENMRGDAIEGEAIDGARNKDRKTTYGFTLGAPIIKNKLFFFVNGEMEKTPTIANRWRGSDNGVGVNTQYISRTKNSDLQRVSEFVKKNYGYDTGSWTDFPADESNYKLLARLDWNINDKNKVALRYNFTKNRGWNSPNGTSMDGGTRAANYRTSLYSMSFANSMYAVDNLVHSVSLDFNSRINDKITNQFLATFSKLDDVRATNSEEFPFIDILDGGQTGVDGTTAADGSDNYMALGYELFTWNNAVHNTVMNMKDDMTFNLGKHKVLAGINYEYQMADNQYMRNGSGYYRYKSVDDFLSGAAPEVVCLTYGYGGETNPAARVAFSRAGIYGQDEWQVSDNFKLTLGLRIDDIFFNNGDLMTNKAIYDLDYAGRHIDTGTWPKSFPSFSPRVGFNWDVFGDKSLTLRGGTGLFTGRLPLVFFTNMPTNSGMVQYQAQINAKNAAKKGFTMDEFAGGLVTDANGKATVDALREKLISLGYPENITPEEGTAPSSISAVDPDFKMPQVWKTSFAVDYQFPVSFPFTITAEGIFNKVVNDACIEDWSISDVGGFARFNGVDNRPIYPSGFRSGTKAFMLTNTNRGYGWSASVSMDMRPFDWMSIKAAYTHTVKKEVTSLPGSAAESAFTYVPTYEGPNNIKLHNGVNVEPDRFFAALTLHDKSGNHFSFIYETWRGGYNYSCMTVNDMNGDGYNYDAIYVPTDAEVANGDFRFVSTDDATRFMDYVHNNSYLKSRQGKYAEGYSMYSPWVHRVDFSYKHDFNFNIAGTKHTIQASLDVKNLLNLFNSSWGVAKTLNSAIGSDARILKYEGVDAQGYATFSTPKAINGETVTFLPNHAIGQCWYASIGAKYIF